MVIDQDICTGCQACVVACAMENNVPFVGEEDAGYGRSMHWIRVERFWEGEYPNIKMTALPAGDVPAMRTCALRAGLPGLCHGTFTGRAGQLASLQPLCRHALLRQQLSVSGACPSTGAITTMRACIPI